MGLCFPVMQHLFFMDLIFGLLVWHDVILLIDEAKQRIYLCSSMGSWWH
jgi:hypothetical protein